MASKCGVLLLFLIVVPWSHAAGIIDIFSWGLDYIGSEGEAKSDPDPEPVERNCSCVGPSCMCCVNFNISFVDLGGPGCVRLKYLSQNEGLAVNVSYGENLLHSEQVKASPKPDPACMNLLSDLAQMCARFTHLVPYEDGLKGCTILEPTLLGDPQAQYPLGCFVMGPSGMQMDPNQTVQSVTEAPTEEEEPETTEKPDLSEEALIAAVNETAEEGIAWFSSLLGLSFGGSKANATEAPPAISVVTPQPPQQSRGLMNDIPKTN